MKTQIIQSVFLGNAILQVAKLFETKIHTCWGWHCGDAGL